MNRPAPTSEPPPAATPPTPPAAPGRGIRAARLGELDSGVVAIAGRGGVVTLDDGSTTVSWWIGAEDRWHRPHLEPSTRDRLVDGTPVVESSVRIPSGDAVGRVTVARVDGVPRPSIVLDIENASPIPVAFAYVVESTRPIELVAQGVAVEGVGVLALTRPALGFAAAGSPDGLVEILEAGEMVAERPVWARPGAVAVLVPLPHTAHAVATFTPGVGSGDTDLLAALSDRESVPTPDRIVAGWTAHTAQGPRLDFPDDRHRAAYGAAVCDLLLGGGPAGPTSGDGAFDAALRVEALGRLGRIDDPEPLADLLDRQRSNGSLPGADPVASTVQFLAAIDGWWAGGLGREIAEDCLGPVANAARWLDRRKQRGALQGREGATAAVLRGTAATLAELDQPEVAAAVLDHAARLEATATDALPLRPPTATMLDRLGDGLSWAGADGAPDVTASARLVLATIDDAVRDRGAMAGGNAVLHLLAGWLPSRAGEAFEAHDVPTRGGRLSYGVRWHGERPALLWELSSWPDRAPVPLDLSATAIDPDWRSADPVGEALLQQPAGATPAPKPAPEPDHGGSFS